MTDPLFCKDCKMHPAVEIQLDAVCKKIEQQEKISNIKFEALNDSINIAKSEMDRRLEGMNEFRRQLERQADTFMSKVEVDLKLKDIESRFSPLLSKSQEASGSKKWIDHIIEVLIGVAVILVVWMITKGSP